MTGWTPERRARHQAALAAAQPWLKSTGPRTVAGKLRSSLNAVKHGRYAAPVLRFKRLLAQHRQWLRLVNAHISDKIFTQNELLAACPAAFCLSNFCDLMLDLGLKEP